jgi:GAF domain-containing protein
MAGAVEETLPRACSELARTMLRPGALGEVLRSLAAEAVEMLGATAAAVLVETRGQLQPAAATDASGSGLAVSELNLGHGPSLEAFRTGAVVLVQDLAEDEQWGGYARDAVSAGAHSVLAVPLLAEERQLGVLTVLSEEPRQWGVPEVAAAEVLAELASGYAAHEAELDEVRRTVDQLQEALESRVDIEQAKGVLVGELGFTVDQAYLLLRNHARRNNVTLRSVAHAVVHLGLRPPVAAGRTAPPRAPKPRTAPVDDRREEG